MGKLQVFEVVFEGDDLVLFRSGDWVQGYVRIVLSQPKEDIRGIKIVWQGKGETRWTESEGSGDNRRSVTYKLEEKYFEEKILILGKDKTDKSGEKVRLDVGEHKFPFRFQIPNTPLPHAFEGRYGHIRYKVKAKIDRPWKFDHNTERLFSIVGSGLDLNTSPQAPLPSRGEAEKTVCCCCCASGPIKVSAQTDKTGYVPGETIWVSGFVDNQSSRDIIDISAKLIQRVTCRAKRNGTGREHTRKEDKTFLEIKGDGCGEYRTATFDRKPLLIPSCPPCGLQGCDIINIEYLVHFAADVSGTPLDAKLDLPITIGTVPLISAYSAAFPPGQVIMQQPSASPDVPPPPSYAEAVGGPQEIASKSGHDYTFGKLMYAPRYPYYDFPLPGSADYVPPPPADSMYPPQGDPGYAPPPSY